MQQPFPRYKVCLFSIWSDPQIVEIEYLQGTCSPIFVVKDFSGLFPHPTIFQLKIQCQHKWRMTFYLTLYIHHIWIYSPSEMVLRLRKNLYFKYFFIRRKFVFCSKRIETIQTIKISIMLWSHSSYQCRQFLLQHKASLLFLTSGSFRELFVFHNSN